MNQEWSHWSEVWKQVRDESVKKQFQDLNEAAEKLQKNPKDPEALFILANLMAKVEPHPEAYAPCVDTQLEITKVPTPLSLLSQSEEEFKKSPERNPVEAKALSLMIRCFKQSYSAPYCFGYDYNEPSKTPASKRQEWFKKLKHDFPHSAEAKSTTVFW